MGVGYSKQEFQQPNLIMDFEFGIFKPNAKPRVFTKRGPIANQMHPDIADEIFLTIENIIRHGDPYNASLYTKYYWSLCCCMIFTLPCWMLLPLVIVYGSLMFVTIEYFNEYRSYSYLAIGAIVILTIIQCYCYCCSAKGINKASVNWRNNIIQKINEKTQDWQAQWPNFSMTIIYPLITRGRKGKTINIRGIIRVTQGAPQVLNNAPLYSQYIQQQQPIAQSELVALNPAHQRIATPVLLQGANGQQMVVQGQKAIINGREVLVVQQPAQQPAQQPINHVVQYAPANPQRIALSTESHVNYNDNNNIVQVSAPPAYNPNVDRPPVYNNIGAYNPEVVNRPAGVSQAEGKNVTVV
eukprot:42303_1